MTATPRRGIVRAEVTDPDPVAGLAEAGWRVVELSGVRNETVFHERIATTLGFPGHYGRNLDALWDCLTDLDTPTAVVWSGWEDFAIGDPRGWSRVLPVLRERGDEAPAFLVVLAR